MSCREEKRDAWDGGDHKSENGDSLVGSTRSKTVKKSTQKSQKEHHRESKEKDLQRLAKDLEIKGAVVEGTLGEDVIDLQRLKTEYLAWMSVYESFLMNHNDYCDLLTEAEHIVYVKEVFANKDAAFRKFKYAVEEVFVKNDYKPIEGADKDHISKSSQSQKEKPNKARSLSIHTTSSVRSERRKEEQRKRELLSERSYLKKKQDLEQAKLLLQQKEEELRIDLELDQTMAKCEVLRTYDEEEKTEFDSISQPKENQEVNLQMKNLDNPVYNTIHGLQNDAQQNFNPHAREFFPSKRNDSHQDIISVAKILAKPQTDIDKFGGDPALYRRFIRQFNYQILSLCETDEEKLNYLYQYTTGEAKKIVSGFSYLSGEVGLKAAMTELYERYGTPENIANTLVIRALQWPEIKGDNPKKLDEFSIFLTECRYAISDIDAVKVLEYSGNMQKLLQKLPVYLHSKWRSIISNLKDTHKPVTFIEFETFVKKESRKVNDPIYGKDALSSLSNSSSQSKSTYTDKSRPISRNSFVVNNIQKKSEASSTQMQNNSKPENTCSFCEGTNHQLLNCFKLKSKPITERLEEIRRMGVCFGCLTPGHRRRQCRQIITCSKCSGYHPFVLHDEDKEKREGRNNWTPLEDRKVKKRQEGPKKSEPDPAPKPVNASSTCRGPGEDMGAGTNYKMAIIPVKVRMKGKSTVVKTYAFLDNGSSITMGTNDLSHCIGGSGRRKKLTLETVGRPFEFISTAVNGIEVAALDGDEYISLPTVYTKERMPVTRAHIPTKADLEEFPHLQNIELSELDAEIGLLIGTNVPEAYRPLEFRIGPKGTAHATKTVLGWIPWNLVRHGESLDDRMIVNRAEVTAIQDDINLERLVKQSYKFDFPEILIDDKKENSMLDKAFLQKVKETIKLKEGHYEISLPFKDDDVLFPDNKRQAVQRLEALKKKILKYPEFAKDYIKFMEDLIEKDYAEKIIDSREKQDHTGWYIPHHGVYHAKKPEKIRVVFDCAATYEGISLNGSLLSGPNLTNNLLGVLLRFRQEKIAIQGDIEAMFYQVRVPKEDTDYLRYLWWPNGDVHLQPESYRMKVHIFGATSSPSCANAALRQTALENKDLFDTETVETILRNFYVDDCLRSEDSEKKAIHRIEEIKKLCSKGGFKITKFSSNSREVLESIPPEERSKEIKNIDVENDELPVSRALGVIWYPELDCFGFKINIPERKPTRRGILSITSSVYDPLGFAAPYLLPARILLQDLTRKGLDWDATISSTDLCRWNGWLTYLPQLESLTFPRCIKSPELESISNCQLHSFADASNSGYGVVLYLRQIDKNGVIHVSMVMAKSRVVPIKKITIPRLELTAATVAVRISSMVQKELDMKFDQIVYWTDSQTVLKYIANASARFYTFVANRLEVIKESTDAYQWKYCPTKENPADLASRGISKNDEEKINLWKNGPSFLWKSEENWPEQMVFNGSLKDLEVKPVCAVIDNIADRHVIEDLVTSISSWQRIKLVLGRVMFFIEKLKTAVLKKREVTPVKNQNTIELRKGLDPEWLIKAEMKLIKHYQNKSFPQEIQQLTSNKPLKKSSSLFKLDPYLMEGLIRIGGRLSRAALNYNERHPLVLPKDCPLSTRIIEVSHKRVGHLGRKSTLSSIRENYWLIAGNTLVKQILSKCVRWRRYTSKSLHQKMADLPESRVKIEEPPFSRVGMDYFGPIEIRRGRSTVKRYGVIFTCLSTRAIHLEVAHSLDMNSCINAIRRFQARRGSTIEIISDNGTNLVGAEKEMRLELQKWNADHIEKSLQQHQTKWRFNPPTGSHFGGVWERLIRIVRKVLYSLLKEQILRSDDEGLQTLFCEVENIINNRPLTEISNDSQDLNLKVLTPNHLLLLRKGPELPPGMFTKTDSYVKNRWRQVQYLADVYWKRWVKEYLCLLQERQKWIKTQRNLAVNDLVLLVDSTPRNSWSLGRVVSVMKDKKGLTRMVNVKTRHSELQRPIHKLCLILEADC